MASASQQSPDVELRGSEVARPQPLRIVKRGQTITGSPSPGALLDRGWEISGRPDEDGGSPPAGADRPLTVRKTRKSRGSVLNGGLKEGPTDWSPGSAILDLIERNSPWRTKDDDPDATPKASMPVNDNNDTPILGDQIGLASRSKKFFLKAIPGRNSSAQKAMRRISSNVSKRIKRPPRVEQDSSSFYYADSDLTSSAMSCSDCQDFASVGRRISFHDDSNTPPLPTFDSLYTMGLRRSLILCPHINVKPELSILDTSACSLWVALEITGMLRRADGQGEFGNGADRYLSHSSTQPSDLRCYGHLHSMRIDLLPGRDCMISEIFGDLRDLKTLCAKETYLVLVKVRLGTMISSQENIRDATVPDDLIAGLESDLSNITTPYLMVRVTYKHSGFLEQQPSSPTETGMSKFSTRMQSEATAVIQRANLQSQWSPRVSCTMTGLANVNPLIKLIETHFPAEKARAALRKLANDRVQIPPAKRVRNDNEYAESTKEMAKPPHIGSLTARLDSIATVPLNLGLLIVDGSTDSPEDGNWNNDEGDRDPARKIWTEIRRTSRGGRNRSSTRNNHRTEEPDDNTIRPSTEAAVEDERSRIKETALKNKRSLGEDSLRSIAPSVSSTDTKPAASSTGLELSMGSRWGWGSAWW